MTRPPFNFIHLINQLTGAQLKVVLLITMHPGAMSLSFIQENTGLSRQSVIRSLKKLREIGFLNRLENGNTFSYDVNWDSYRFTCVRCRKQISPGSEIFHFYMQCEKYIPEKTQDEIKRLEADRVNRRNREKLIEEFGGKCSKCGSNIDLTIDHILPVSKDGSNDRSNLQVLCKTCNSKKGNR